MKLVRAEFSTSHSRRLKTNRNTAWRVSTETLKTIMELKSREHLAGLVEMTEFAFEKRRVGSQKTFPESNDAGQMPLLCLM